MKKYFNVKLEFDKQVVDQIIDDTINNGGKGYVCSVERTVMSMANIDSFYNQVVNSALVNICDGNFVAQTISLAHGKKYCVYIGADLFLNYIKKIKYKQYFLGNTPEILEGLKKNLSKLDPGISEMPFVSLPFKPVKDFDYLSIAKDINSNSPDIIWVSLGAPKQEEFMYYLEPYINKGVMFGFGAIFNFYSGLHGQKRAPKIFLKFQLEWLYRLFQDPSKNLKKNWMYLKMVPHLISEEKKLLKK